jgi:hypothetical protein
MKKILYIVTLFSFISAFISCSNEEASVEEAISNEMDYTQEFSALQAQLQTYNQEFSLTQPPQLRSSRDWKVIGADALGAVIGWSGGGFWGAVIGAAIFSAAAQELNDSYTVDDGFSNYVVFPNANMALTDSVGYYHNYVIQKMYNTHGSQLFSKSIDELTTLTINEVNKLNKTQTISEYTNFFNDKVQLTKIKNVLMNGAQTNDVSVFLDNAAVAYPAIKNELKVMDTYFNSVSSLSNVEVYSAGFSSVVASSQIPVSSVSAIKSSVSVAANSNVLWK